MRYHPSTLEEARSVATRLDYETKDGGLGVDACPKCGEQVFVVESNSTDGAVYNGYCMNSECRSELSEAATENDTYAARVHRTD